MTVLAMTKLIVADVEKAKAFYEPVCQVREVRRINAGEGDAAITELIMAAEQPGGATLVLFQSHGRPSPAPGSCVLVFETDDVQAFVDRAVAAGGRMQTPVTTIPAMGLSYAYVQDPEGHVLEPLCRKG